MLAFAGSRLTDFAMKYVPRLKTEGFGVRFWIHPNERVFRIVMEVRPPVVRDKNHVANSKEIKSLSKEDPFKIIEEAERDGEQNAMLFAAQIVEKERNTALKQSILPKKEDDEEEDEDSDDEEEDSDEEEEDSDEDEEEEDSDDEDEEEEDSDDV